MTRDDLLRVRRIGLLFSGLMLAGIIASWFMAH